MQTIKYVYWQDGDAWLGYLQDYPDYWTQGESLDDLIEHLTDLYRDVTSGELPGVRKVGELVVIDKDLDAAYAQMARDEAREAEALEWAEATVGDVADEGRFPG